MWQYIITGAILAGAAAFVIYRIMRTFRGNDTFSCAFCTKETCPTKDMEETLAGNRKPNAENSDSQPRGMQEGEAERSPEEEDEQSSRPSG